ncbi:hypothetical protein V4C49_10085 [Streptococcus dysgalactiae subsp. dysgalactiae]|uniref:hypothetical protein n=1 Tax=Streptococcus dysgalactiae TaxID=1334 RepID=UPI003F540D42
MTLVDDFYNKIGKSIKQFMTKNLPVMTYDEFNRVYSAIATFKRSGMLPPPNVLVYFAGIFPDAQLAKFIDESYLSRANPQDRDEKIYEEWQAKKYGSKEAFKAARRKYYLAKAWEMGL